MGLTVLAVQRVLMSESFVLLFVFNLWYFGVGFVLISREEGMETFGWPSYYSLMHFLGGGGGD